MERKLKLVDTASIKNRCDGQINCLASIGINMARPFYLYVDVDETFVRNYGTKRIPMPPVIEHIKQLKLEGAIMYCWSSGGAEYAHASAIEFGIDNCFVGFLPKPEVMLDDMRVENWANLVQVHPNECPDNNIEMYREKIIEKQSTT